MESFVTWFGHLLALVGVTIILVWSVLFRWLQKLYKPLFACALCMGFWVGVFDSIVRTSLLPPVTSQMFPHLLGHLYAGAIVSLASFVVYLLLLKLANVDPAKDCA